MFEGNPGKIDLGSSSREFRVIGSQLFTVLRTRAGFILMHTTGFEVNHVI